MFGFLKIIFRIIIIIILITSFVFLFYYIKNVTTPQGIQAQLTSTSATEIPNNSNVVFNSVIHSEGEDITYNAQTGEFTINRPGNYLVSWWYGADGAGPATSVSFAVFVNGVPYAAASTPIVSGVVSGDAFITVENTPETVTLVNVTGEAAFIPATPVKSGIVIVKL